MSRFIRLQIDEEGLTNALYDFITDPSPSRTQRPVYDELHEVAPEVVDVAECMILDGVDERRYVADYVHAIAADLPA